MRPQDGTRPLDAVSAALALALLSPVLAAVALLVKATSPGPVLFRQTRVGLRGLPFTLYKFRTMCENAERLGSSVTTARDGRVTPVGRLLRKTKLDELPQLLNVVKGDMVLVGPRPEVPEIVEKYTPEMRRILSVRPGITGLATLFLRDEEELLARAQAPDRFYEEVLLPVKVELGLEYIDRRSPLLDLKLLALTLWTLTPLRGFWKPPQPRKLASLRASLGGLA